MKWYTLKWEGDDWGGVVVEHFPTRAMAERRDKEVQETSGYVQTFSITENEVNGKRELIEWLNLNYDRDNG